MSRPKIDGRDEFECSFCEFITHHSEILSAHVQAHYQLNEKANFAPPNTALRDIEELLHAHLVNIQMFYGNMDRSEEYETNQAMLIENFTAVIQDNQTDLRSWFSQPFDYRTALVTIEDGELGTIARIPYLELEKKIGIQDNQEPISVNRVEVIDHTQTLAGRDYTKWEDGPFQVEFSKQDGGRTLKIFLSELEEEKTL